MEECGRPQAVCLLTGSCWPWPWPWWTGSPRWTECRRRPWWKLATVRPLSALCAVLSLPITKECSPIPVQTPALHVDSFFHCVCIADLVSVVVLPLLFRLSSPLHPQLALHPQRLLPPPLHPCQWHVHAHSHPPVPALTRLAHLLPGHHKQPHRPVARPHLLLRHEPLHLHQHPSRLAQPGAPPEACKPS